MARCAQTYVQQLGEILFRQLDLFNDFTRLHVVPEKRPPVGVGDPECIALPADTTVVGVVS
jgi:hypothetical protein